MFDFLSPEASPSTPRQISQSLHWLGWTGFWLQALLGFIPILVMIVNVLFTPRPQQLGGFSPGFWLAIVASIILLFSIYWCFRYTRLASKVEDRELRPAKAEVIRDLKLGLVANLGLMACAVFIALLRVSGLTFKMLTVPQGATLIAPNQTGTVVTPGALVTPSNMIAIQAMVSAIAAGLVGVLIALLLLNRVGPVVAKPRS
jgi:hypothetical protein